MRRRSVGLLAAVAKSDLPEWLADALLDCLDADGINRLRDAWRCRRRDAIDAIRAHEIAGVRSHPEFEATWERAYLIARIIIEKKGYSDMPLVGGVMRGGHVSTSEMKRSYERVRRGLADAGRYYWAPGIKARIAEGRGRMVRRLAEISRRQARAGV